MAPEGCPESVGELKVPRFSPETWGGAPCDAVIICLPTPLAGKGTARQLEQAAATFVRSLGEGRARRGVPFAYVGAPVDGEVAELRSPLAAVEPAEKGVAAVYRAATAAFESALGKLYDQGVRRPAIVSMGYTAYGPEAAARALAALGEAGRKMSAVVCLVDSTYPDTDELPAATDAEGWPESRFYGPAFRSSPSIRTLFFVTSAYDYDPALLNGRAPDGMDGAAVISPPYSKAYVAELESIAGDGKRGGLGPVAELLPGLDGRGGDDLLIPIVGSDIWSPGAVGVWMSAEQHTSCLQGTRKIVEALGGVAEETGRRIWVPVDVAGAEYLRGLALPGVAVLPGGDAGGARVVLSAYRDLSQRHHARLLGAADVAVSRTGGQANSTVVLALARTPNVVVDMPACGYMQSELTSLATLHDLTVDDSGRVNVAAKTPPLGWLAHWTWSVDRIREQIADALRSELASERTESAYRAYVALNASEGGNLFRIVERLVRH